jgi:hemoglobin
MQSKHRGLHITGEQRLRFVTLLSWAADEVSLPDDPDFRAAVMG